MPAVIASFQVRRMARRSCPRAVLVMLIVVHIMHVMPTIMLIIIHIMPIIMH